mmetsp:Transcript_9079/g.29991  ORF Transcript_9079/g.29991 Transcript_9079/m.29991 type:complete len:223 (-) Transcript_9079:1128-1796(-)
MRTTPSSARRTSSSPRRRSRRSSTARTSRRTRATTAHRRAAKSSPPSASSSSNSSQTTTRRARRSSRSCATSRIADTSTNDSPKTVAASRKQPAVAVTDTIINTPAHGSVLQAKGAFTFRIGPPQQCAPSSSCARVEKWSNAALKTAFEWATSSTAQSSRIECMLSMGAPTSTVLTPSPAALMGPMVEPQAQSARTANSWHGATPPFDAARRMNVAPIASVA